MAFKIQILSVILFVCLIDSLHSASLQRMKRGANEEESTTEAVTITTVITQTPSTNSTETTQEGSKIPSLPIDVNSWTGKFEKIVPENVPVTWYKDVQTLWVVPSSWFSGNKH